MPSWEYIERILDSTGELFGGKWGMRISKYFNAVDIGIEEPDKEPEIATKTRFQVGKLLHYDFNRTHTVNIKPDNGVVDHTLKVRSLSAGIEDYITTDNEPATLLSKTLGSNTIMGVDLNLNLHNITYALSLGLRDLEGSNINVATITGTGANSHFEIIPSYVPILGATDVVVAFGRDSGINKYEWYSNIPGINTKLFDIQPTKTTQYVDLDTNQKNITNIASSKFYNSTFLASVIAPTLGANVTLTLPNHTSIIASTDDSRFTDDRTPLAHAVTHKGPSGIDLIRLHELGAPTTNTTSLYATASLAGLLPPLTGSSGQYFDWTGGWSTPTTAVGSGTIIRNSATKTGDGTQKAFTIVHGSPTTPLIAFVTPKSTDALGSFTTAVDATNITITYSVAPPAGTSNLIYSWFTMDAGTGSALGESNTYSSVGTGVPLTKTKSGVDLPFKSIIAGSSKITITNNTNDLTFDVAQANLSIAYSQLTSVPTEIVKTNQTNTFGNFAQIFTNDTLKVKGSSTGTSVLHSNVTDGSDYVLNLPMITGTLIARNSTDTLLNKTLTDPIIARIDNGGLLTLPTGPDTILGRATSDTVSNKNVDLTTNTVTASGAAAGGIPVHNGTKYVNQPKGSDGTYFGVQAGVAGFYAASGGGSLPDGSIIPTTGRWGAFWGGTLSGRGVLDFATPILAERIDYTITSATETATNIYTDNVDDDVALFMTAPIFSRQASCVFKVKWNAKQTTNTVIMIGVANLDEPLPNGGSHDNPLNNLEGVLIKIDQSGESVYKIVRNDGDSGDNQVSTAASGNNTSTHTCEINLNPTNVIVTVDGVAQAPYTTEIPTTTTPLAFFMQIEAVGNTEKGLGIYRAQVLMS